MAEERVAYRGWPHCPRCDTALTAYGEVLWRCPLCERDSQSEAEQPFSKYYQLLTPRS